jgi:hypothetical protein
MDPTELGAQTQIKISQWSNLMNATGGALKPEKSSGTYWATHAQMESGPTLT